MFRNHVGRIECRLCLTVHPNEANYLAHTQGRRHQANVARRRAMEAAAESRSYAPTASAAAPVTRTIKIGRPAYKVLKSQDPSSGQWCLQFTVLYPEIEAGLQPRHRFMSAYEQRVEAPDKAWQYLLFAAAPYSTIAFKVPAKPVDKAPGKFETAWDADSKTFTLTLHLLTDEQAAEQAARREVGHAPPSSVPIIHNVRR